MEPIIISSFLCHPVVFANYLILSKFLDKYILLNLTISDNDRLSQAYYAMKSI